MISAMIPIRRQRQRAGSPARASLGLLARLRVRLLVPVRMASSVALALLWGAALPARASDRSSVLYPPRSTTLRFDHARHAAVRCERCHRGMLQAEEGMRDDHFPREAVCRPCHGAITRPSAAATPGAAAAPPAAATEGCRHCHPGLEGHASPPRPWRPRSRLRFSHALHAAQAIDCGGCHRFPAAAAPAATASTAGATARGAPTTPSAASSAAAAAPYPRMATCTGCHARQQVTNRCGSCHLTQKDGRLITRFGAEALVPATISRGDAHGPLFSRQHAAAARAGRDRCLSCHLERDCLSCHAGLVRPMSIHGGDYLTAHAIDARRDQPRCASCHRAQSFCLSCHLRLGVAQGSSPPTAFRPDTGRAFHPPGFNAAQRGPAHHAAKARRNVAACASCHTEQTCLACHADSARGGGGFSPHGPGFAHSARCAALARRNPRVCVRCHASADAARSCEN
ncbi:MAG: hypothetical protein IPL40_13910 [Proteobacteria bacterium]|nr:hypothetical protein [Pseudomonadota bacterium]